MDGGTQIWGMLLVAWLLGAPLIFGFLSTDWRGARTTHRGYADDRRTDDYAHRTPAPGPANQRPIA